MQNLDEPLSRTPEKFFSEWLKVYIPGSNAEATFPIPPEFREYFEDCLFPPSILFYAKAVLETTARLFNKSGAPDYSPVFPDKIKFPALNARLKEWKKLIEIVQVDRVRKRSRLLKEPGATRCSLGLFWEEHPDWPDWPTAWPKDGESLVSGEKWRRWAKNRSDVLFTLVK
ncbi:MAG: hypothetical protein LBR53_12470 [Deltaproteobacteria bacterium]|jgi:hypothetical protein|nr:hypothetical protein [Deltaproteobacteria bacterium]